jgi:beta-glucoside operon transcriptional antiterminator
VKLVKKINNNFALALDSKGEEVIVSGRGIGFIKMPCELNDLSKITRTYYDIDEKFINLINQIPEEIIAVATRISDLAKRRIESPLNPNLIFTLADHINFSIERKNKGIVFEFPMSYDFEQIYQSEVAIAEEALKLIKEEMNIELAKTEVIGIALNIINSEMTSSIDHAEKGFNELSSRITKIIEHFFSIEIDQNTVNYSRFTTHLRYLFKRLSEQNTIASDNLKIFESLQKETPKTFECVEKIGHYLNRKNNWKLDSEEKLYLVLHVNRLLNREDCNRQGITSNP